MTDHIAKSIDAGKPVCWPKEDPFSPDPVVWAWAYMRSCDWMRPRRTMIWFSNAMAAAADASPRDDED